MVLGTNWPQVCNVPLSLLPPSQAGLPLWCQQGRALCLRVPGAQAEAVQCGAWEALCRRQAIPTPDRRRDPPSPWRQGQRSVSTDILCFWREVRPRPPVGNTEPGGRREQSGARRHSPGAASGLPCVEGREHAHVQRDSAAACGGAAAEGTDGGVPRCLEPEGLTRSLCWHGPGTGQTRTCLVENWRAM